MATNPPGYSRSYFQRKRREIIVELIQRGRCCRHATPDNAEIHHIDPLNGNRPNGSLARLTEWLVNKNNLEALCYECHRTEHCGKEWYER